MGSTSHTVSDVTVLPVECRSPNHALPLGARRAIGGVFTASETSRIRPPCAGPRLADGQLDTALDDSRADGIAGETGDIVDVEFRHEILPMFFDRLDADAEFHRGLIVGLAFGNQLEHLHLS